MNKNIIWLAIGGVVAYLLLTSKKSSATKVEEPPKDSNITTKVEEPKKGNDSTPKEPSSDPYSYPLDSKPIGASKDLLDAMEDVAKLSIGQIMGEYNKLVCRMTAAKIKYTPEEAQKREIRIRALRSVAFDRGVKLDCDINKKLNERFKFSPVYPGNNIPYGAPPIDNIKRLATGIN